MTDSPAPRPLHRWRAWLLLCAFYVAFFCWYTPLGGALSEDEIEHYVGVMREMGRTDEGAARWIEFMRSDTGDDFAMFNAIDLRDAPERIEGVGPDETSSEVMARYVQPFFAHALPNAAHPVLLGQAANRALDIWGIDAEDWDQGGVVRYRSRRDVMNQIETLARSGEQIHDFKIAALEKTIAYPLDPWFHLGDPRLVLALVFLALGFALEARRLSRELARVS